MSTNSCNFKGLPNGISLEASCFTSQSVNDKNPQRDLASKDHRIKQRQRLIQIFFVLILMGAFTKSFAQSGNSCSNAVSLGNLKDSVYNLRMEYPQTEKWFSFTSDSSFVNLYFGSSLVNNQKIKINKINLYSNCGTNLTNKSSSTSAGIKRDKIEHSVTTSTTYFLKVERYYNLFGANADVDNKDIKMGVIEGNRTFSGICPTICANMLPNGGFECYENSFPFLSVFPFYSLYDWNYANGVNNDADYFSVDFPIGDAFHAPIVNYNNLIGNGANPLFTTPSNGFIKIETFEDLSDIVEINITPLTNGNKYYVSYDLTAGKDFATFTDMVDLDVVPNVSYNVYTTGINYLPILKSNAITNSWQTRSTAFTASNDQKKIFIGNLAQQAYISQSSGTGSGTSHAAFIDNVMLKPFEIELGDGPSVCAGTPIEDVKIDCEQSFIGATYEWTHLDDVGNTVIIQTGVLTAIGDVDLVGYTPTSSETLTLTITLNGLTATDTYDIIVSPGATASISVSSNATNSGVFCDNNGVISIVDDFVNSLVFETPIADTYQWSMDGVPVSGATNQTFTPVINGIGNYTVSVHTTLAGGCDADASIDFSVVANRCQLACNTVLGQSAFFDQYNNRTNYVDGAHNFVNSSAANFSSLPVTGPLVGQPLTYVVDGIFTINTNLTYENVTILISPGGKIVNNGQFNLINCQVDGCEQMWDRIENRGDFASSGTTFRHGEAALELFANCSTRVENSTFTDNVVGIYSRKNVNNSVRKTLALFSLTGSTFQWSGIEIDQNLRYPSTFSQNTGAGSNPLQQPQFFMRPANGLNIQYVNTIAIGQNSATNTNHFLNMWNGITLNSTTGIITNCRFTGMEASADHEQLSNNSQLVEPQDIILISQNPNFNTHYSNIVTSAISIQNSSTLNLFSLIDDDINTPTFSNCFRGVTVLSSNLNTTPTNNTDYMFFNNVNTGVRIERLLSNQTVDINRLNITFNNLGVVIFPSITLTPQGTINFAPNNSSRLIHNNTFNARRRTPLSLYANPAAIQYREISSNIYNYNFNNTQPLTACEIRNNVINGFGAAMGIEVWNARNTIVRENIINFGASQGVSDQNFYKGIYLLNTFASEIRCNTINDNSSIAYSAQNGENAAIWCNSSLSTIVSQNSTSNFKIGIRMTEFCTDSRLEGNNIGDHNNGLFYDLVTDVGDQLHTGNRWLGSYSEYGAKWSDAANPPSNADIQSNEYTVDQTASGQFMPPTRLPGANWFIDLNSGGSTFTGGVCNPGLLPQANNIFQNIMRLAKNNNDGTLYGNEKEYNAKKVLFERLEENDSLLFTADILREKYDSIAFTNIKDISELNKLIGDIYLGTQDQNINLAELVTSKNNILSNWVNAVNNNDSHAVNNYASQLQQVNIAIDAINQQIQSKSISKRNAALRLLNTIAPNNVMEQNMKAVQEIYLSKVYDTHILDLSDDAKTLKSIAYQCPIAGGDAVFIARMLYLYLVPDSEFDDISICNIDADARKAKKEDKTFAFSFNNKTSVYPSPSKGIVHINSNSNDISSVIIRDLSGRVVLTPPINKSNSNTIDCVGLGDGLYLLEINYENFKSEVFKINILK